MRCFAAVDLSADARTAAGRTAERLRARVPEARWVSPESMHLTLEFLGDVEGQDVARLGVALAGLRDEPSVELSLGKPGVFPGLRAVRVLWLGVESAGGALEALARRVRGLVSSVGLGGADDKPFVAHLTLARFRRPSDLSQVDLGGESRDTGEGRWLADRVILYQSLLSPAGAEYRPLCEVLLEGRRSA